MVGALRPGLGVEALVAEVRAALTELPEDSPAVVALSGGADSSALALLARRARPDLALTAVHVRHGLRDDAEDADAAADVAAALGLPLVVVPVDVVPAGEGVEAAARAARHAALLTAAREVGAPAVLYGHTADDQAETVLLALGRGTGVRGLAGMRGVREEDGVLLVRPLLRLRRAGVRALVEGLATVEDPTNADPAQRRRRVRTEVLPALARLSGGSGDPVALLTRLADLARDDADLLERLAAAESARMVRAWGPVRVVRAAALRDLPPALGRRVVRALLAEVRGGLAGLDAAAVDRVLALAPGGEVTVAGGARVTANGGWLAAAPGDLADLPVRALGVPGTVALPELGLELRSGDQAPAEGVLPPRARQPRGPAALGSALLGPEARDGLIVRARQPGDRVGHRSLGDRFTDLGVPRALRGLVPVVALAARPEEPLWVPGVALSPPGMGRVVVRLTEGH